MITLTKQQQAKVKKLSSMLRDLARSIRSEQRRRCRRRCHRHRCGFTLIEMLVVIGVIALILALLLPGMAGSYRAAKAERCDSNLRQIAIAAMLYRENLHAEPVIDDLEDVPVACPYHHLKYGVKGEWEKLDSWPWSAIPISVEIITDPASGMIEGYRRTGCADGSVHDYDELHPRAMLLWDPNLPAYVMARQVEPGLYSIDGPRGEQAAARIEAGRMQVWACVCEGTGGISGICPPLTGCPRQACGRGAHCKRVSYGSE